MGEPTPPADPPSDPPADPPAGNWYEKLSDVDLRNNATLQKYTSAEEAHKGHLKLQESFGMDKQVWPKDANDKERWAEVNKRLGVPEKADGYGLKEFSNPDGLNLIDRLKFQDAMKDANAPKALAEKVWDSYTGMMKENYGTAEKKFKDSVSEAKNEVMKEWGDKYEGNIVGGQQVIDMLAGSQEEKDALTVALSQSSAGIKFLSKIKDHFVESSIGGFEEKQSFTKTPTEAREELDRIKASPEYRHDDPKIRGPVIKRADELMAMVMAKPG